MKTLNRCLTQEEMINARVEIAAKIAAKKAAKDTIRKDIRRMYEVLVESNIDEDIAISKIVNKMNIYPEEVRIF